MSIITEIEDKINQYSPLVPFAQLVNESLRPQDYPMDAMLYQDIMTSFVNHYNRVAERKEYEADKAQAEGIDSE